MFTSETGCFLWITAVPRVYNFEYIWIRTHARHATLGPMSWHPWHFKTSKHLGVPPKLQGRILWRWWKDKNAIPDVSTPPHCWPTHVTFLPTQNEAIRFRFLTPKTRRVFLQVSCGENFWAVWTAGPTGRGRRGRVEGNSRSCPRYIFVYPSHWRRRWTIGTRCQFYFLKDGSPRDLKPVRQTDLRLSILDFV